MLRHEEMHDVIVEELENYFAGDASAAFHSHLANCPRCAASLSAMDEITGLLRELKPPSESVPEPRPGFYNRVAAEIVDHQRKEVWGLFSPGAAFFRRIAFASLLTLAALGGLLVTRDNAGDGQDAAAIIAQHDPTTSHAESADRDRLLVTLATYRQ